MSFCSPFCSSSDGSASVTKLYFFVGSALERRQYEHIKNELSKVVPEVIIVDPNPLNPVKTPESIRAFLSRIPDKDVMLAGHSIAAKSLIQLYERSQKDLVNSNNIPLNVTKLYLFDPVDRRYDFTYSDYDIISKNFQLRQYLPDIVFLGHINKDDSIKTVSDCEYKINTAHPNNSRVASTGDGAIMIYLDLWDNNPHMRFKTKCFAFTNESYYDLTNKSKNDWFNLLLSVPKSNYTYHLDVCNFAWNDWFFRQFIGYRNTSNGFVFRKLATNCISTTF